MNVNTVRKGSYVLVIEVKDDGEMKVGKLGVIRFNRGYYAYVGSCICGLCDERHRCPRGQAHEAG